VVALVGVPEVPVTAEARQLQMESLGARLADEGMRPVAAISMFESWSAICKPDEDMSVRPSDRPDRKEVIAFAGMTADGRTAMSCVDIVRNADGGISLGETRVSHRASDPGEGNCSNFLLEAMFRGFGTRSCELISKSLMDLIKGKSGEDAVGKPDWDEVLRDIPDGVPKDMN
jgi:hypothetical protein